MLGNNGVGSGSRSRGTAENKIAQETINTIKFKHIHRVFSLITLLETRSWLRPVSRGNRHFTVGGGRLRQSGPRSETISLRSACTRRLMDFMLETRSWLRPVSRGNRHFTVGGGRLRQSGPRSETISLRSACTRRLMDFITNGFSLKIWPEQVRRGGGGSGVHRRRRRGFGGERGWRF
ncbi:hypothetical protein F511_37435 [Dorcoceras hygrometricum]|uniref:Uncharacterized protein n=1 Tax=Dorcoceras hygrometricum TaxID=472368 RepID=A0A2Z7AWW5_9LAMI|nr:hypothetical protein F511_37435 [Dorcoceras hygrometricum]